MKQMERFGPNTKTADTYVTQPPIPTHSHSTHYTLTAIHNTDFSCTEPGRLAPKAKVEKTTHSFIYKLTMHKYFFTSSPLFVGSVPTESCQPTKPERLSFSEQSTSSDIPLNFIETSLLRLSLVVKDRKRIDSGGNFKRLAEFQLVKAMPITFYFVRN